MKPTNIIFAFGVCPTKNLIIHDVIKDPEYSLRYVVKGYSTVKDVVIKTIVFPIIHNTSTTSTKKFKDMVKNVCKYATKYGNQRSETALLIYAESQKSLRKDFMELRSCKLLNYKEKGQVAGLNMLLYETSKEITFPVHLIKGSIKHIETEALKILRSKNNNK